MPARAEFDSALRLLEARAGRRVGGPWREQLFGYFVESPDGFYSVRDDLLERPGIRAPIPYFMRLLKDGDHRAPVLPAPEKAEVCPECERGGGYHLDGCELAP